MANVIVGQLLPCGVVKGGSALKLRYGYANTRFTTDLDAARDEDLEIFIDELAASLESGWNGFTGTIAEREPAHPTGVPEGYVMQPFDIKLAYNGKSWVTVPLEIGHDEIELLPFELPDGRLAVFHASSVEPFLSEHVLEIFPRNALIIRNQDARSSHFPTLSFSIRFRRAAG